MVGIFICYRRADAGGHAGRLFDFLRTRFPGARVFKDTDSIHAAMVFDGVVREAVQQSLVLLAVIGKQWSTLADQDGRRRLDDPKDLVRQEISLALERGIRVMPVLVQDANVPKAHDLPDGMKELSSRHAIELRDTAWQADAMKLEAALRRLIADHFAAQPGQRLLFAFRQHFLARSSSRLPLSLSLALNTGLVVLLSAGAMGLGDFLDPGVSAARHAAEARLRFVRNELADAERHYRRAIRLDSGAVQYHLGLAHTLLAQNNWSAAIGVFRNQVLSRDSLHARATSDLAWATYRASDVTRADSIFRRAMVLGPLEPEVHRRYGIYLDEQGRRAEAAERYREVIRLVPADHEFLAKLGYVLGPYMNQWSAAADTLERAVRLHGGTMWYRAALGQAYAQLGRWDRSVAEYQAAVNLAPDSADNWYHLGIAKESLGYVADARNAYARAMNLNPEELRFREAYDSVGKRGGA
jgi:tetratricopeptide (TPR) repeat protein